MFYDSNDGLLDDGLLVLFRNPRSFTGEDVCEFHLHGSRAVVDDFCLTLAEFENCRAAVAGEFTERAFRNEKLDLTSAEGLADLLNAETRAQREQALAISAGGMKSFAEEVRQDLVLVLASLEALIDFSDQEDVTQRELKASRDKVLNVSRRIEDCLSNSHIGEVVRDGFKVVLFGRPNSGKSSMMNCIADREVSIVTNVEGTTRDAISVHVDVDGYLVEFVDTAGIRPSDDVVESIGIERAIDQAKSSDLALELIDMTSECQAPLQEFSGLKWTIGTKADLLNKSADSHATKFQIDCRDREDVGAILEQLGAYLRANYSSTLVAPIRARHTSLLGECLKHLQGASSVLYIDEEIAAEEVRLASHALAKITGKIDVEEVLDSVFSQFCVGK